MATISPSWKKGTTSVLCGIQAHGHHGRRERERSQSCTASSLSSADATGATVAIRMLADLCRPRCRPTPVGWSPTTVGERAACSRDHRDGAALAAWLAYRDEVAELCDLQRSAAPHRSRRAFPSADRALLLTELGGIVRTSASREIRSSYSFAVPPLLGEQTNGAK